MNDIPVIPACAGSRFLFFRCRTEYQSLNLFSCRSFRGKADYDDYDDTEQEHPSAEEEPVHIVEQIFEGRIRHFTCVAVIYFGTQTSQTDDHTGDQSPHTTLCGSTFPADTQQEGSGNTRSQYRLNVLQISIKYITYACLLYTSDAADE